MNLKHSLISEIQTIISESRQRAIRSVNHERVLMYWKIGKVIFEEEQDGKDRAKYGTFLIKSIAEELQPLFGSSFSKRHLYWYVQFYRNFSNVNALRTQFSWSHYRLLIRIDNPDKREFYIAEAEKNNWSTRQLERQINSGLFERLLISNDIEKVLAVAKNEEVPSRPADIIKDPMVLEFLGLKKKN